MSAVRSFNRVLRSVFITTNLLGQRMALGVFTGMIQKKYVEMNVKLCLDNGVCTIYSGGWELPQLVAVVGTNCELKVLRSGWFYTIVILTNRGEPFLFTTRKKFGEMLRPYFGSEAYDP